MKLSNALSVAALAAMKSALDGGKLYYFAGPVPASAEEALDMGQHTQLLVMTVANDGTSGLTFATPTGAVLSKTIEEEWKGTVAFDGAQAGETTLTPTFFRFGAAGDNCRGASTGARLQGTIGGASSDATIKLTDGTTVTANGTNARSLPIFNVNLQSS